jgi:hypothetical protein
MTVVTPTAGEDVEICKTPSKQNILVTTSTTLTPCRLGDTSARQGCGGRPIDDPVSVRCQFSWRVSMKIPACWVKMSPSERRTSGGREWGSFAFILLFIIPSRGFRLEGSCLPRGIVATQMAL